MVTEISARSNLKESNNPAMTLAKSALGYTATDQAAVTTILLTSIITFQRKSLC